MNEDEREPSHALPMHYYRDPLEALIINEAGTCKGCVHEGKVGEFTFCTKGKPHGRRCKLYVERMALGR